ncbi:MAG: PilN domain-containing protein [Dissulfurimicrobium sp.]|uniref:PilN domain-containing protein n=1 Tax=Dissulfurimicrobium TaxID=1769732 RepID=UPI001EDC48D3|nr:PilN domain-containing protein [Dissulfurimicrobium hydrothermale]UKL13083.1 PilN domain-containing protein [Dissulfurimicrobium hydrothermale]
MIKINLLPVREWCRKESVRKQVSIFSLSFILLLTILGGIWITIQGRLNSLRQELNSLTEAKAHLIYVNRALVEVEKKRQIVKEKFSAIEALQKDRTRDVEALDKMVGSIPVDRLWLTKIFLNDQIMKLNGVAMDNQTVALFMKRLETVPMFYAVNLTDTKRADYQGHKLMDFEIQLGVKTARDMLQKDKGRKEDKKGI